MSKNLNKQKNTSAKKQKARKSASHVAQNTKNTVAGKKILLICLIALIAVVAITMSVALIFSSSPIGKLLTKLNDGKNYHLTATVGSFSFEQKVDGNVTYTSSFLLSPEQYKEVVGDEAYIYTKNSSGEWTKKKSENSGNAMNDMLEELVGDLDELTNPKNYKKVKGEKNKYAQKDNVNFEGCKDVVITIEEDKVIVEMIIDFEGLNFHTTVVISEIGEVELTLPEVLAS